MSFCILALGGDLRGSDYPASPLASQTVDLGHAAGNDDVRKAVSGSLGDKGTVEKDLVNQDVDAFGLCNICCLPYFQFPVCHNPGWVMGIC